MVATIAIRGQGGVGVYTLVNLVIDGDVVQFDTASEIYDYLLDLEDDLQSWLVQEWSGSDILNSNLIESIRADRWLEERV